VSLLEARVRIPASDEPLFNLGKKRFEEANEAGSVSPMRSPI
jgi:hypothetical protein